MDSDLTKERLAGFRPLKRDSGTRDVVACCMPEGTGWALEKRKDGRSDAYTSAVVRSYCGRLVAAC
jgi:hypothetical protein